MSHTTPLAPIHYFKSTSRWSGDNSEYDTFSRRHPVEFPGGAGVSCASFLQSAGTEATNPEELLLAAQSSCLLLTFLAVSSRSGVKVTSYEDQSEAVLEKIDGQFRVTKIILRPQITVSGNVELERLNSLIEKSHKGCYIANSIRSEVVIEPTFVYN